MMWAHPCKDDVELLLACGKGPVLVRYLKAWALGKGWSRTKFYRKLARLRKYGWIIQKEAVVWVSKLGMKVIRAWEKARTNKLGS
ncbi:MAG: hypothetical protein ABIM74_09635 [candidate division WOR-3 bacterium]